MTSLVAQPAHVRNEGDHFGGVGRRPGIRLSHIRIGNLYFQSLAIAGLECDQPCRFKLSGEAAIEANDCQADPPSRAIVVQVYEIESLLCAIGGKRRA